MSEQSESHASTGSPMPEAKAAALKDKFYCKQTDHLWGQPQEVEPVLLSSKQWGDGRQIIALRPIILRKSWYVIAIDSSMEISRNDDWRDLLDEDIYEELAQQFGIVTQEDQEDIDFNSHEAWPAVNHEYGHEWWQLDTENSD